MVKRDDFRRIDESRDVSRGFSIESSGDYDYVVGELRRLADALDEWRHDNDADAGGWSDMDHCGPMYNTGYCFANNVFIVMSYDWDWDDPVNVNLYKFDGTLDITWYKWFGRGTYGHNNETFEFIKNRSLAPLIDECIESLCTTCNDFTGATSSGWTFSARRGM